MPQTWDLLQSPASNAAFNMALDEALFRGAAKRGRPLLRLYSWEKPTVSFGYFQKFPGHLAGKYDIVRRPTGGGLVYHGDDVDTTYTVIVPPAHPLCAMSTTEAYCAFHKAVAAALEYGAIVAHPESLEGGVASASSAGVSGPTTTTRSYECFQNPVRGDVMADGRKLAGGAQRRNKYGMLHQGSIAKPLTAEQLVSGFSAELDVCFEARELTVEERTLASCFIRDKYTTDAWNRRVG